MRLLNFIDTINSDYLLEAAANRYQGMIDSIPAFVPIDRPGLSALVPWAIKNFKKDDRIVWFLRWARLALLHQMMLKVAPTDPDPNSNLRQWVEKFKQQQAQKIGITVNDIDYAAVLAQPGSLARKLEHFLGLNIPEINRIVWDKQTPRQLLEQMGIIEAEWQKQSRGAIRDDHPEDQDKEKIIEFPDGSAWFNLNKVSCDLEAQAMGHCGNAGSRPDAETVLSYRTPKNIRGKLMWEPHMTFILNTETGKLGEMKGRNNKKPIPKYHPYIIALLKSPLVKGIRGGGYKPEENFSLKDLPNDVLEQLLAEKPELGGLMTIAKMKGYDNPEVLAEIQSTLKAFGFTFYGFHAETKMYNVVESSYEKVLPQLGIDGDTRSRNVDFPVANYVWANLRGDRDFSSHFDISLDDKENILDELRRKKPEDYAAIQKYVWDVHIDEDLADEYSVSDMTELDSRDMARILDDSGDELDDDLRNAGYDGYERGAENDMYEAFQSWLKDPTGKSTCLIYQDGKTDKGYFLVDPDSLFEFMQDEEAMDHLGRWENAVSDDDWSSPFLFSDLDEPRYGWSGYDEDSAIEYLYNMGDHFSNVIKGNYKKSASGDDSDASA